MLHQTFNDKHKLAFIEETVVFFFFTSLSLSFGINLAKSP